MHLIKLCVGVGSLDELAAWQDMRIETMQRAGLSPELVHRTRQMPRHRDALLPSGSLFWVIKGYVRARQRLLDLREETDMDGRTLCGIVLDPRLVETKPQPRRPFQGWRYLKPEDAPDDLGGIGVDAGKAIPEAMRMQLAELALL